jgi:hypothetical protein
MDPPKKKVYQDLSEQEIELLEKLLSTLNKLYRNKDVYRRPRGRPRKVQEHPGVKPSKIPEKHKLKLTRKQLTDLTVITRRKREY